MKLKVAIKVKGFNPKTLMSRIETSLKDPAFLRRVNQEVVEDQIKTSIARGLSPVKGQGRFEKYKDKDKYPGKKKGSRPVNLFLSGDMLSWYKAELVRLGVSIGIVKSAPKDIKVRARANNEGVVYDGDNEDIEHPFAIPPRRFIPLTGEEYNVTIMRKIKNIFADQIQKIFTRRR